MKFIELTDSRGNRHLINILKITEVIENNRGEDKRVIIGVDNGSGTEFPISYDLVIKNLLDVIRGN